MTVICLLAAVLLVGVAGCNGLGDKDVPADDAIVIPTYEELAASQNGRVGKITSYWARGTFEVKWREADGSTRTEIGDGHLVFKPPNRIALTLSKLGEEFLWAGCDDERFWLFLGGDDSIGYVGRNENVSHPAADLLPLPVHPLDLLELLGLFALPDASNPADRLPPTPEVVLGHPGRFGLRYNWDQHERPYRFASFNPDTLLPDWVGFYVPGREPRRLSASLTQYASMSIVGLNPGEYPKVPEWVEINDDDHRGWIRLSLRDPSDRTGSGREINNRLFDYKTVKRKMRPGTVVVLDARCPVPAVPLGESP
ncbi:MAG: hypothetical protein D8M59_01610 [Planctomycetes bacterium]|nr:hypothetical protein [Planctomycetota bacterium]